MSRCSHVLVRVTDLPSAVADFRSAGFDVHFATREDTALHAHVWFPDGPIIELLTTPRAARVLRVGLDLAFGRGAGRRMVGWAARGEGFCDVAVLVDDRRLDALRADLAAAGVATGRAVRWTRTRPDGRRTRFRFSYPRIARLPFLVTPYDPPQHPPAVAHRNGATGVRTVVLGVQPSDEAAVTRLLGGAEGFRLEPAEHTGVLAVEFEGLRARPDPALTHGAVLVPAA
ncbi:VOC family protein [Amycolatopsis jejuensis]|uniref:VOC family protein n=1 Tax=Amycolatopsis jejuensis TaxID=330084 RepID=UPI000525BA96|nr:VOC family protein [Amycolatopsis jejuensis]